jgi:hypothetical protein
MSERRFPMDSPETLAVQVEGGIEVIIRVELGQLQVNVIAPGKIDGGVFRLDEDGDARVEFHANGRQQIGSVVSQGPGAIVEGPCQYSAKHKMDGVPATTTIDCGRVGIVAACQACADLYVRLSR